MPKVVIPVKEYQVHTESILRKILKLTPLGTSLGLKDEIRPVSAAPQ
jgi:hypothetical protein